MVSVWFLFMSNGILFLVRLFDMVLKMVWFYCIICFRWCNFCIGGCCGLVGLFRLLLLMIFSLCCCRLCCSLVMCRVVGFMEVLWWLVFMLVGVFIILILFMCLFVFCREEWGWLSYISFWGCLVWGLDWFVVCDVYWYGYLGSVVLRNFLVWNWLNWRLLFYGYCGGLLFCWLVFFIILLW